MLFRPVPLKIGFVPLVDCAPLVLAKELGFFEELGLQVELVREPGWASIRDKVAHGEIDAAHALAGLCFAISWGLGVVARPCLTGFLLNAHGDAITLSKEIADNGVSDGPSLAAYVATSERRLTFGIPHSFSAHHFLLRQWLRSGSLVPERDVDVVVLPPSQMNTSLEMGFIDGFCVGEPFNTMAVASGSGIMMTTSVDIVPMHPEKALLVSAEFAQRCPEQHDALIKGLSRACAVCDTPAGRAQAVEYLSKRAYLDLDDRHLRTSLGDDRPEFHVFFGNEVNVPTKDKANWLVNQMRSCGLVPDIDRKQLPSVAEIFREDLYQPLNQEMVST